MRQKTNSEENYENLYQEQTMNSIAYNYTNGNFEGSINITENSEEGLWKIEFLL